VANYVHVNVTDGLPLTALELHAAPQLARPPEDFDGDIYLQPMDMTEHYSVDQTKVSPEDYPGLVNQATRNISNHNQLNLNFVVQSCMKHGYTIQLQIHKLLRVE
jgi:hypothetical protein